MKRILGSVLFALGVTSLVSAATLPIYINSSPLISPPAVAPQIDARAWVNQALFNVTALTALPYQSINTLFFTNETQNFMSADPGFRFLLNVGSQRLWMDTWENRGTIDTGHNGLVTFGGITFFIDDSRASILQVAATNILNTGPLSSGAHGIVRLEGNRLALNGSTLRTGDPEGGLLLSSFRFLRSSNYVNDVGVTDLYWGVGRGNAVDNSRSSAMLVNGAGLLPPNPISPVHEIIEPAGFGFFFTNTTIIPSSFFFFGTNIFFNTNLLGGYSAAVNTSATSPSNLIVQVVLFPTNNADPNFATDVRFYPQFVTGFGGPSTVVVGFHSVDFDIATETQTSNSVFLVDDMASTTNYFLSRNSSGSGRRPNIYEIVRQEPFEYTAGLPGNSSLTSNVFFNPSTQLIVATNQYAAYAAQVGLPSSSPSGSIPYDPTNMPGRIEILGGTVNIDQTRIRAESAVIIKATDLVSNRLATVDAPLVNYDVRSTQPELQISNLAPVVVRRMSGIVRAWSGIWRNFELVPAGGTNFNTNTITYHVLMVDNQLQTQMPVTVNEFAARGTNIVVEDLLQIGKSFVVEGNSWHVRGGLTLPLGLNLGASNLIGLRNFTNDGFISIAGSENFGGDRTLPYQNYVNRGTNIAATHTIRTGNFENSGALVANGGVLNIDSVTASMLGNPLVQVTNVFTNFFGTNVFFTTNLSVLSAAPIVQGTSTVQILARDLTISNSIIDAGTLIVGITNRLSDAGPTAVNRWNTRGGFRFIRRPATSDLLGTYLRSTAPRLAQIDHYWAATNLGATTAGFTNNMALGKLSFDGGSNCLFRFFGVGTNNAIYVDYLEFSNFASNFNAAFAISANFTIYFANANVAVSRLDGAGGGRFRWVRDFAGPLSSTNLTYPSGSNYTFNIALVSSRDIDSDGDGTVNAFDPTPIYVPESATLRVSLASLPELAVDLQWTSLGRATNILEFRTDQNADWEPLTNFIQGEYTMPVLVKDPIKPDRPMRVYRLKVEPPRR